MLIAEELMLVTRADSGYDHVGYAETSVAGALLCELALRERVSVEDERLVVIDRSPTGDVLLDEALSRFAAREGKKPKDVLARVGKGLAKEVLERLSRAEVLQERPTKALGVRWFSAWDVVDTDRRDALREELLLVLTGGREPDGRTGSLISLLRATSGLDNALPKDARHGVRMRDLRASAKEVAQGRWASQAVADAVQASAAAAASAVAAAGAGSD